MAQALEEEWEFPDSHCCAAVARANCHQLLGSHSSPLPGEVPFVCSVCLLWPATSSTLQANGTSDTFSATHSQGWAVGISASGGKGAFFASVVNRQE